MENTEKSGSQVPEFGVFVFFLSFVPYIYALYKGITGIVFGLQNFARFYGVEGVIIALISTPPLGPIIPLACLIYQIVFVVKVIRHHNSLKIGTLVFICLLVIATFLTEPLSKAEKDSYANSNIQYADEYISDKYGTSGNSGIKSYDGGWNISYEAKSAVLPDNSTFNVYDDPALGKHYTDDLMDEFLKANKSYSKDFCRYLVKKYNISGISELDVYINKIEFGDYRHGDDYSCLFDKTDFTITTIVLYRNDFSEDKIEGTVINVWKKIYPKIKDNLDNGFVTLEIDHDDHSADMISIYGEGSFENSKPHAKVYSPSNTNWIIELD